MQVKEFDLKGGEDLKEQGRVSLNIVEYSPSE
jgi:hypothetical protein